MRRLAQTDLTAISTGRIGTEVGSWTLERPAMPLMNDGHGDERSLYVLYISHA
jgi:hypothetical protein